MRYIKFTLFLLSSFVNNLNCTDLSALPKTVYIPARLLSAEQKLVKIFILEVATGSTTYRELNDQAIAKNNLSQTAGFLSAKFGERQLDLSCAEAISLAVLKELVGEEDGRYLDFIKKPGC
jgi:hypothetical protein